MKDIREKKGECHAIVTVGGISDCRFRCLHRGARIASPGSHGIEDSVPRSSSISSTSRDAPPGLLLRRATLPLGCDGKGHGSSSLFVNGNGAFGETMIQVVVVAAATATALPEDNGSVGAVGKLKKKKKRRGKKQDEIVFLANIPFGAA